MSIEQYCKLYIYKNGKYSYFWSFSYLGEKKTKSDITSTKTVLHKVVKQLMSPGVGRLFMSRTCMCSQEPKMHIRPISN